MDYKGLYLKAKEASKKSYSPYSKFKVGACVETEDGRVFSGCNIENVSFGATICAERVACTKAISEGYNKISKIAIYSRKGKTMPCGICRQFLYEFNEKMEIITGKNEDELQVYPLNELMPEGFDKI